MDVCRLCSRKMRLIHVFNDHSVKNLEIVRYAIYLSTGVEIKETDIVSKMVCHQCCDISIKLHRYRMNAIANDKMLKHRRGQLYIPQIVTQERILPVAVKLASEQFKQNGNTSGNNLVPQLLNQSIENNEQSTYGSLQPGSTLTNSESRSDQVFENRRASKVVYKHWSISELYQQYQNIILPVESFGSNVSPVISLDSAEVSNWYAEQVTRIQKQLKNVVIKKIVSDDTSSVSADRTRDLECTIIPPTVGTDVAKTAKYALTGSADSINYSNANLATVATKVDTNDLDCNKENDAATIDQIFTVCQKSATKAINEQPKKKRDRQPPSPKKQSSINNDDQEVVPKKKIRVSRKKEPRDILTKVDLNNDYREDIPKRKTRAFRKKERKNIFKKLDLPIQFPSDETQKKAIFTSSLELRPNGASTTNIEPKSSTHLGLISDAPQSKSEQASHPGSLFMCLMCNKVCESKNQLIDHERKHFSCKFCKKELKSFKSLKKHQSRSCCIISIKAPSRLRVTTAESIPEVACQYSEAFKELSTQKQVPKDCNVGKIKIDRSSNIIINSDIISFDEKQDGNESAVKINDLLRKSEIEVISLQNGSDDNNICTKLSKLTAKTGKKHLSQRISAHKDNNISAISSATAVPRLEILKPSTPGKSSTPLTEINMIYSLFNKYLNSSVGSHFETDVVPKCNIKCIDRKFISLGNAISEFRKFRKVGIDFEYHASSISAKFQKLPMQTHQVALESWQCSRVIDITNPDAPYSTHLFPKNKTPLLTGEQLPQRVKIANEPTSTTRSKQSFANRSVPSITFNNSNTRITFSNIAESVVNVNTNSLNKSSAINVNITPFSRNTASAGWLRSLYSK